MREHRRLTGPWLVHAGGVRINRVQMPVTDGCGDGPGVDPPGGEVGFGVVIGEDRGEAAYLRGLGGGQAGQLVFGVGGLALARAASSAHLFLLRGGVIYLLL